MKPIVQTTLQIIAAFCVTTSGMAQEPQADKLQLVERAMGLVIEGKPLAGIKILESAGGDDATVQSAIATLRAFASDPPGALKAMEKSYPPGKESENPFSVPVEPSPAIDAIVEQAKSHRIVVINEAHHVSQHRAFVLRLLPKLRDLGFKYFAAEALDEDGQNLKMRGYPTRRTGFYTNDHVFGDVIRKAVAFGFTPVAYEATSPDTPQDPIDAINVREEEQCRNLVERLFTKDAKARVIIHVGFDHAMERPRKEDGKEIKWLAARIAVSTGTDPLTIDQTEHSERGLGKESPQWQQSRKNGWLTQPIVLNRKDGTFDVSGHFAGFVDIQVLHPPSKYSEGRPDWLPDTGRSAVAVPDAIRAVSGRVLVEAFIDAESEDAVPFDRVVLAPSGSRPKLLLAPGKYRIVAQDEQGTEIKRLPLECIKDATEVGDQIK